MWTGLLPETFLYAVFSVGVFTLIFSISLWKMLLRLQQTVDVTPTHNDIVGHSFMLEHNITAASSLDVKPTYVFSGISWRLDADKNIKKGRLVMVVQTAVGILRVKEK